MTIDISSKPIEKRSATAVGTLFLSRESIDRIKNGTVEKGNPLENAKYAAIHAVKKTPEFVFMAHPIPIEGIKSNFKILNDSIKVKVTVITTAKTGVEIEALAGVMNALLAVFDMCKMYEKDDKGNYSVSTKISEVYVVSKEKKTIWGFLLSTRENHITNSDIPLSAVLIIVSDSLTAAGKKWKKIDTSAKKASEILQNHDVEILNKIVVPDEIDQIQEIITEYITREVSLIITIGGTGISSRDVTVEAIFPLLEKELPGFGELFRIKTYEEVGTLSIMTRALAGVVNKTCIVSLPGSTNAVELGTKLILQELLHIVNLRNR